MWCHCRRPRSAAELTPRPAPGSPANNSASGCWATSFAISRSYSAIVSFNCRNSAINCCTANRAAVEAPIGDQRSSRTNRRNPRVAGSSGYRIVHRAYVVSASIVAVPGGRCTLQLSLRWKLGEQRQKPIRVDAGAAQFPGQ